MYLFPPGPYERSSSQPTAGVVGGLVGELEGESEGELVPNTAVRSR